MLGFYINPESGDKKLRTLRNSKAKNTISNKTTVIICYSKSDFLDIELNLPNKTYIPFWKPNSDILYVNNKSNNPNQILKQLPITINERLNKLSSNEESFNRIKHSYQSALKSANYKFNLTYQKANEKTTKKQRKRKKYLFQPTFFPNCSN